ncbi:MAG: hypothetical protein AB1896_00355 [Thermodesulfobacteriota bacterium]
MTVKFIQYFDLLPGQEKEFRSFAAHSYLPGVNGTGLVRLVGSWYVACGEGPYFIFESTAPSVREIQQLLELDEFAKLNRLLHFLITNYKTKVLAPGGLVEDEIPRTRHFRFNHHWNVNYARFEAYERFMRDSYLPTVQGLGLRIIGGWEVTIGPGPGFVVEGAVPGLAGLLAAIGRREYRELIADLLGLVSGFGSKILVPTGLTG